jgi:hypothetical protein
VRCGEAVERPGQEGDVLVPDGDRVAGGGAETPARDGSTTSKASSRRGAGVTVRAEPRCDHGRVKDKGRTPAYGLGGAGRHQAGRSGGDPPDEGRARDGVVPPRPKGLQRRSADREATAADDTVLGDRLVAVFRAGRLEPAGGRQQRRDVAPVAAMRARAALAAGTGAETRRRGDERRRQGRARRSPSPPAPAAAGEGKTAAGAREWRGVNSLGRLAWPGRVAAHGSPPCPVRLIALLLLSCFSRVPGGLPISRRDRRLPSPRLPVSPSPSTNPRRTIRSTRCGGGARGALGLAADVDRQVESRGEGGVEVAQGLPAPAA